MKFLFILIVSLCSFMIACKDKSEKESDVETTSDRTQTVDRKKDSLLKIKNIQDSIQLVQRKESILLKITQNILTLLKNKNYLAFANYIDPVDGIRFSPYAYVDTLNHLKFSRTAFITQAGKAENEMKVWGNFDGSGDPIKMTLNNYMKRFVYDVDFAKPEERSVNDFLGHGNSLNNLKEVYKDCNFTENYFSGFDKKYEGMDWKTLRLVFKERNKRFYLIGIVHDEWTI